MPGAKCLTAPFELEIKINVSNFFRYGSLQYETLIKMEVLRSNTESELPET